MERRRLREEQKSEPSGSLHDFLEVEEAFFLISVLGAWTQEGVSNFQSTSDIHEAKIVGWHVLREGISGQGCCDLAPLAEESDSGCWN